MVRGFIGVLFGFIGIVAGSVFMNPYNYNSLQIWGAACLLAACAMVVWNARPVS